MREKPMQPFGNAPRFTPWESYRRNLLLSFCRPQAPAPSGPLTDEAYAPEKRIKVVCTSDTHNTQPHIPDGDVLLHAGDLTNHGTAAEVQAQLDWLASLPHTHKVVIAGNHDKVLDPDFVEHRRGLGERFSLNWHDITYLRCSSVTLDVARVDRSLKVYGDPETPEYGRWAFQHPRNKDTWTNTIPPHVDVLLTHGPPMGHLDWDRAGCPFLLKEIRRARPRLVLFGHIHEARGHEVMGHGSWDSWARDQLNYSAETTPGLALRSWSTARPWTSDGRGRIHSRPQAW
jgi:Icc-related predicted phosphoesterase